MSYISMGCLGFLVDTLDEEIEPRKDADFKAYELALTEALDSIRFDNALRVYVETGSEQAYRIFIMQKVDLLTATYKLRAAEQKEPELKDWSEVYL